MFLFYRWGSTASKIQSHYSETVSFSQLSSMRSWYLLDQCQKSKRLSKLWNHPVAFNLGRDMQKGVFTAPPSFPLSLETCILPPLDTKLGKIPNSIMIHWNQGDWKQYSTLDTFCLLKLCVLSSECVLIDIMVTISIAVGLDATSLMVKLAPSLITLKHITDWR